MAATQAQLFVLCLACASCATLGAASSRALRGEGTVATDKVEASLRKTLEAMAPADDSSLAEIEARMWKIYQALPKNEHGRLSPQSVRYLAHAYFSQEHGWLVGGLEPNSNQFSASSQLHKVSILEDQVPTLLEPLLEFQRGEGRGLLLADVVALVSTLERLIMYQGLSMLEASYSLNGFSTSDALDEASLSEVLVSHLILLRNGAKADLQNASAHQNLKVKLPKVRVRVWQEVTEIVQDAILNFEFAHVHRTNPFVEQRYSFMQVALMMDDMQRNHAQDLKGECHLLKAHLMELDVQGTGLIPLSRFYKVHKSSQFSFRESKEYLKKVGALEEQSRREPSVRISNYMRAPSNCMVKMGYSSVCCSDECEDILTELQRSLQASRAAPGQLLGLVRNLSFSSSETPQLTQALERKLEEMAAQHGGKVPLHGRLFAQWLHFVFPHECPFPEMSETTLTTVKDWLSSPMLATEEEMAQHIEAQEAESEQEDSQVDDLEFRWSHTELLPLEDAGRSKKPEEGLGRSGLRVLLQLALLVGLGRAVASSWQPLAWALGTAFKGSKAKQEDVHLPF